MFLEDAMFNIFPIFFMIIFCIVIGGFIFNIAQGISNRSKPIVPVKAIIKGKRSSTTHHNNGNFENGINSINSSTSYYITFEFDNGQRMEFSVGSNDYGMLCEGDFGTLEFQGTRFVGFKREI